MGPTPRRRAVRLTESARHELSEAIRKRWAQQGEGKLTREARAELLNLSVTTSEKVLNGKGVDRATLVHAYQKLEISWSDEYCSPLEPEPDAEPTPPEPPTRRSPRFRPLGVVVALLVAVAVLTPLLASSNKGGDEAWVIQFNEGFAKGVELYHRGRYRESQTTLNALIDLARNHDSAGRLAAASALSGELELATGDPERANDRFREALTIRRGLSDQRAYGQLLLNQGIALNRLGRHQEASQHLEDARLNFERLSDRLGAALVTAELGTVAANEGNLVLAEERYVLALKQIEPLDQVPAQMDVRGRLALVWLATGRVDQAHKQLEGCLDYWATQSHPRWTARAQLMLGKCESRHGRKSDSEVLLRVSKAGFTVLGDKAGVRECEQALRATPL